MQDKVSEKLIFSDRLMLLDELSGLKKKDLADLLGVTAQYLSSLLKGRKPGDGLANHLEILIREYAKAPYAQWLAAQNGITIEELISFLGDRVTRAALADADASQKRPADTVEPDAREFGRGQGSRRRTTRKRGGAQRDRGEQETGT